MSKQYMKTYADAHNHLSGILPAEALKIMLSRAKANWDQCQFDKIPETLIEGAERLSFSNTCITNDYGWFDCLDILSRLIVFSFKDIKRKTNNHASKDYHKTVKNMLFVDDGNTCGSGRGMNCAGILLAGCMGLRCLVDNINDDTQYRTRIHDTDRYFIYLQGMQENQISFGDMFLTTCLMSVDNGLNEQNWLFNKLRANSLNPILQACAERIAISSITSALSTSLWAPFDDNYAVRGLLKRGKQNKINYLMLTLRWLMEKEAVRGNYFSEISIGLGDLPETYGIIKANAATFGFKGVATGGKSSEEWSPLILENHQSRKDSIHNNKLYLRFLTGYINSQTVRWDVDIEKVLAEGLKKVDKDKEFGCWAGIDMFGIENFVYDRVNFMQWLTAMYGILRDINKESGGKRNLWLRPHVGEGSWVEDLSVRTSKFDGCPLGLAKKLKSLSDFFKNHDINKMNNIVLNEVLEFIYRSIFTGWLPIDDIRNFYDGDTFSSLELQRLSSAMQPTNPSRGAIGEKIGTANLETMIDWINHISPHTIEQYDRCCPQIRIGHGSHLGFDRIWGVIADLQNYSFMSVWVDLNLGSNVVTASKSFSDMSANVKLDERLTNTSSIGTVIKKIVDNSRFICGYIQTEIVERSERIAKFIDLLKKHGIIFVIGTDGQGSELTSVFSEHSHFNKLICWYYKDSNEAESTNKALKSNTNKYIKYALGNIIDYKL